MGKQKVKGLSDTQKAYLDVHLNEYNQLRNEILDIENHRAAATNYSLIITAALITFLPQAIKDFGAFVLLLAPMPFWGLIWYVITLDNFVLKESNYIRWVLSKKINYIFNRSDEIPEKYQGVFEWEVYAPFPNEKLIKSVMRGVIFSGRQVLLLLPIFFSVGIFIYITRVTLFRQWYSEEIVLIIVNILCVVWFTVVSLVVAQQHKVKYPIYTQYQSKENS